MAASAIEVRAWARIKGYNVAPAGPLPGSVIAAYNRGRTLRNRYTDPRYERQCPACGHTYIDQPEGN